MTRAERETAERQQEKEDLRAVMATPAGRRFVWRLVERAKLFSPCFVPGDTTKTIHNEGRRESMLPLFADLTSVTPAEFQLATSEAIARKTELEQENQDHA